ncbi:hypothetical protein AbraIFM66951_005443 [Aspergillus brasiliensis]|uniref:Zn(2)-C6 fungal-type domain-containing protein n=1 Tax=Aspergillus brasiliensis TaxID=319629 RepID=A0A9W5Z1H6_9EURO|nr:hypothetical protein AbraCBS73388_004990 [Aspergillus brasiliensis]GKZ51296.1 hypothetical protein AbraIFM66951_005443 [Aspergillus brasiliensis]
MINTRRRNGKPAACEPCRKDKVRCDHQLPACSRCHKRQITARCVYLVAPVSQVEEFNPINNEFNSVTSPVSDSSRAPTVHEPSLRTGYLGPTSFVAALGSNSRLPELMMEEGTEGEGIPGTAVDLPKYWHERIEEVLHFLNELPVIEGLVQDYYHLSQSATIPAPLVLNALSMMVADQRQPERRLSSASIIKNTAEQFVVQHTEDAADLHQSYTGTRLRLEIIGVVCAIAGRASAFGLGRDISRDLATDWESRSRLPKKLLAISDITLQVCRLLTPVNDLTIWALHENLLLSSLIHGDSSSATWHRLGDLSTSIFELGLHRSATGDLPLCVKETRRRVFAAAYQLDKSIATFLGRPPRISWRHSDCNLPLDLSDDILTAGTGDLQRAISDLDDKGWDTRPQKRYQRSSWIRLRFLISTFREEILELALQEVTPETAEQLRDISDRCHRAWETIPSHMRYSPNCWKKRLPISVCLMLSLVYLSYLYNDLLIFRLLERYDSTARGSLVHVSATILSTVLALGAQKAQPVDIQRDFLATVLLYGFPSASELARALHEQARTGQPTLYRGSRSTFIRDLSVFVSHLETMALFSTEHSTILVRASQHYLKILDEVLDPSSGLAADPGTLPEAALPAGDLADALLNAANEPDLMAMLNTADLSLTFDNWI